MSQRKPILVIEDSEEDFAILEMYLRAAGVKNPIDRCSNGSEVDAYLERMRSATSGIPVFVFLDLKLPGVRGEDVLVQIKKHDTLDSIPVVVLTTSSHERDVASCYKLGAASFLTKPVDLDQFEQMIQHVADYWFACVKLPEVTPAPPSKA